MTGIYKKLRAMGHSIKHSLSESMNYNLLPFGGRTPVEFHIEDYLNQLERAAEILSSTRYDPNTNISPDSVNPLVDYLNSQLEAEKTFEDVRFSQKQRVRYDTALEKLAQAFPRRNN